MIVVLRFHVAEDEFAPFLAEAEAGVAALAAQRGFLEARLGRGTDDPTAYVLTSRWDGPGAYRRALSSYRVKVEATPLLARAAAEPSAFEELITTSDGSTCLALPDRAPDADTAAPGDASPMTRHTERP